MYGDEQLMRDGIELINRGTGFNLSNYEYDIYYLTPIITIHPPEVMCPSIWYIDTHR